MPKFTEVGMGSVTVDLPLSRTKNQDNLNAISEVNNAVVSWADQVEEEFEGASTSVQPKKQGNRKSTWTRGNNKHHHK